MLAHDLIAGMVAALCLATTGAGHPEEPEKGTPRTASVQVFVSSVCPISNGYAPELKRLYRDYRGKGVQFYAVYSADQDRNAASRHAREFGFTGYRVVHDPDQVRAKKAGVAVTPEVAVWDAKNVLRYRGRIDDRYAALGVRREQARSTDLRNALDALIAGKPVPVPRTRAVGCSLPVPVDKKKKP
jgi:thiol-disulfide isomerase/thioredoxin